MAASSFDNGFFVGVGEVGGGLGLYIFTILDTIGLRCISSFSSSTYRMAGSFSAIPVSNFFSLWRKSAKPLLGPRSLWKRSPVITILDCSPILVVNMTIWLGELFCISSAIMKARLKVRPRIYASGDISIVPPCNMESISFWL